LEKTRLPTEGQVVVLLDTPVLQLEPAVQWIKEIMVVMELPTTFQAVEAVPQVPESMRQLALEGLGVQVAQPLSLGPDLCSPEAEAVPTSRVPLTLPQHKVLVETVAEVMQEE
jgi:hypothetical protein